MNIEQRPYQITIVNKSLDCFANGIRSVMIESPTGSGKTCMGHLVAKRLQEAHPDLVVGWVAMRRNLLTQAASENVSLGINVENIHYVSMFDKNPEALFEAKAAGKKLLIVMDESQHDSASTMVELYTRLKPDFTLGLTATPFRSDNVKLCFEKTINDAGIHRLISDGFLSSYDHWNIEDWKPQTVADHYCRQPEVWGKSVVFFNKWEDCAEFTRLVNERSEEVIGILRDKRPDLSVGRGLVRAVRGDSGFAYRDKLLDDFRAGDVVVLANCMILTEGFDADDLETAFVRDSVKGPTMQMGGRALRPHPRWRKGGDERFRHKNIVQSVLTKWPMPRTAAANASLKWQSDSWRSMRLNPHIEQIGVHNCHVMASVRVEIHPWLQQRRGKEKKALPLWTRGQTEL
jgi:superfamily II DNA or RNA helicase